MANNLTYEDILKLLRSERIFLRNEFGVVNIGLFGSYAKGTQKDDSDIDLLVEFEEPRFDYLAGLQIYLEKRLNKKIELVRKGISVNRRLTERLGNEVIYA
ncbi:MAG TPA: nucleotidyltransferase domain-containing protein [Desulfatiglandales bacterium]|nr:nucleotidyltransferase domain-containing protein [Desulfatiglandales bacterium]